MSDQAAPQSDPRNEPHYPEIVVQLTGTDGNAFAIMGAVKRALRENGVPQLEIDQFLLEATSGDYNHLLQTCMSWVTVR